MEFLYAAELKKRFVCYGHFYALQLNPEELLKCRSVLEVVDSTVPQENPSAIWERAPDVVVVMMNPGSSHPKDASYVDEVITYPRSAAESRHKPLVLTQPDNTQYQVMRVAVQQGWHHIRVLNLSDLRDPKSGSFLQKVGALSEVKGGHLHSIFSPERTEELMQQAFGGRTDVPVMLGWGQDIGLIPLATQCLDALKGRFVVSVESDVHPLLNAHPSPMLQAKKLQWLESMLKKLSE